MSIFQKVNAVNQISGVIRSYPEDFIVDEIQSFTPTGEGEHVWLHIKKTGENTDWVAGLLAKIANVPRKDVSFAGMKDRNAVTTQWFSVQMPGREAPDWQKALPDSIQILDEKRHNRKLRRGTLNGNHFQITIRNFEGIEEELSQSIEKIRQHGIPNYFGEQRFGHNGLNVQKAEQWFKGEFKVKSRPKRSIYLSAARSWIFNHVLSERVKNGTWNKAIDGDVFMLDGTKSCFTEPLNNEITKRVEQLDLHPTGVLWGRGRLSSQFEIAHLEKQISEKFSKLCDGLERNGLKQERKSLRLIVKNLNYTIDNKKKILVLKFSLPAGAYATSVLEELGKFSHCETSA